MIATWLIDKTGTPTAPSYYLIAAALASAIVIFKMRETANKQLA